MISLFSQQKDQPKPLISHLRELRARLLRCLLAVFACLVVLTPFSGKLYHVLAKPLRELLPPETSMIAIEVASPFLIPFKLALLLSIFITAPYWLTQCWGFVAPGMYQHEKKFAAGVLVSSIILFYLGAAFAWFIVLPLAFSFFLAMAPEDVAVMTDISHYLRFSLKMFLAFGVAFEIPVVIVSGIKMGFISPEKCAAMRPYIIVLCFIVGMLITPPDVVSQILLAVPAWLLFELGLWVGRRI